MRSAEVPQKSPTIKLHLQIILLRYKNTSRQIQICTHTTYIHSILSWLSVLSSISKVQTAKTSTILFVYNSWNLEWAQSKYYKT